jgi:hypothetical protein
LQDAARYQPSAFSAQLLNKFCDFSRFTELVTDAGNLSLVFIAHVGRQGRADGLAQRGGGAARSTAEGLFYRLG